MRVFVSFFFFFLRTHGLGLSVCMYCGVLLAMYRIIFDFGVHTTGCMSDSLRRVR